MLNPPPGRKVIPIQLVAQEAAAGASYLYEKTQKFYPRSVAGWFARWRWVTVWLTQLVF